MPGDYSRKTFDHQKHYSSVLMQQGRVQLDADWNEQAAIQQYRFETESIDTIGSCGVPKLENSFEVQFTTDGRDLMISAGRIYVDGILCELGSTPISVELDPLESRQVIAPHLIIDGRPLGVGQWLEVSFADGQNERILKIVDLDEDTGRITFDEDIAVSPPETGATIRRITTYLTQPHDPEPDKSSFNSSSPIASPESPPQTSPPVETVSLQDGSYLVFLDAWQQEITAFDDPFIQEVALGKADTTTRLKNIWQVKLLPLDTIGSGEINCKTVTEVWEKETSPSTGLLNARSHLSNQETGLCQLPLRTGYRRVENQLYRVEIHKDGDRSQAFFKWSRDNATVETQIRSIDGRNIVVDEIGKDDVLRFNLGQWVEVVDDFAALKLKPNPLFQIESVSPATNEITLNNSAAAYINRSNLKLRRWDQNGDTATETGVAMTSDWIDLEDGIQVMFSEGSYHSGDYWLIPARTATGEIEWPPGEIPNENPIPQPPLGISHHYCRLATFEVVNGVALRKDCRELFPSLTEICAEDVCFDNSSCELPEAKTVQDALDMLCAVRDLRHHNKFLHGYGVVCGLKVKCNFDNRNEIIVERGYALDCEGFPINLDEESYYDIVTEAKTQNLLDTSENGQICLYIAGSTSDGARLGLERYGKEDCWDDIFEGTLLKDFYEGCIENLFIFLLQQFPTSFTDDPPVPITQRRLTAFINLLLQLVNSDSGRYVFLSGQSPRTEECDTGSPPNITDERRYEDKLLYCFYDRMKDLFAGETTYCAMFDQDRPFPDYDIDPGLETIFGPTVRFHHRLRLYPHPSRNLAYTCGLDNKIYVYDLGARELVQTLVFPASKTVIVQDVAISHEESTLYAVGIQEEKDSVFATADIAADGTHTWGPTSIECGVKYVSLALGPAPANQLYAIQKAKGLFEISGIGQRSFLSDLIHEFNATGILDLSVSGTSVSVFAAQDIVTEIGTESTSFDQIIEFDPSSPAASEKIYKVEGDDFENDIEIHNTKLYVTGNPTVGSNQVRTLYIYDTGSPPGTTPVSVDLKHDTFTRLAIAPTSDSGDFLLITLADRFKVVRFDLVTNTLDDDSFRIPVQIFPMDIAVSANGQMGYVLNIFVNTLTAIDIPLVVDPTMPAPNFTEEPPEVINQYCKEIRDAFSDVLSHFLQYLKDCFCDKFLIDCPTCGTDDKVYLGRIEIQEGRVYNICNFTKRHYAKSFPTWSYWLSTIPILPFIKQSFAKFCCSILESDPDSGFKLKIF